MSTIESIPGWRDMTAAELVAFTQANPQTSQPIKAVDLQDFLRLNRLSWIDIDGHSVGIIPDLVRSGQLPSEVTLRIEGLLSKSFRESATVIETDSDEYAELLGSLMSIVNLPGAEIAKFYALGGGRKYPLFTTEAEATAAQAAAIEVETLAGLRARIVNAAALMGERVAVDADPFELFAACWEDAI